MTTYLVNTIIMKKSFFEYLALADVERIHSQFLAWVLSNDCSAIEEPERHKLFSNIFSVGSKITTIQTERNGIDILIETPSDIVAIENKIKSTQHSNQLERYKTYCIEEFPNHRKHFFLLTLIDEKTKDNDWQGLTYSTLFKHLSEIKLKSNNDHSAIINEYLIFLKRLDAVVSDFRANAINYDLIFLQGNKRKHSKLRSDYTSENEWFIATNQLETILQKSYFSALVEQIKSSNGIVDESWGTALVDFHLEGDIEFEGRKYFTGIQLQGSTIKFIFTIQSEPYKTSKKEWIEKVIPLMDKLRAKNEFKYFKLNKPTKLAYVSISKKLDGYFWHKPINELTDFVQAEIDNGKEMTSRLKKLLTIGM